MQSTPPLSVMYALQEGLAMIRDEGFAEMWQPRATGQMARLGLQAAAWNSWLAAISSATA